MRRDLPDVERVSGRWMAVEFGRPGRPWRWPERSSAPRARRMRASWFC